jgi:hypothetical protein
MSMEARMKCGVGAVLATLGGMAAVLAPTLGVTALERPWSFLAGFVVGLVGGLGVGLALFGLIELKRTP